MTEGVTAAALQGEDLREGVDWTTVVVLARKELRDSVRDRWFWLYAAGFALVAAALVFIGLSNQGVATTYGGFGRATASLVTLAQLIVPLMGLTLGARTVASGRERGTLRFLLSLPVNRTEAFLGMFTGTALALAVAVAAGFGAAGVLGFFGSASWDPLALGWIALLAWLLSLTMLSVGMLVSVLSKRASTALGLSLFVWLLLTFLGDLGIMGTAAATRLPVNVLFASVVVNPVEAFRLASMITLHGSLDVLGPAGFYAVDTFGSGLLWVVVGAMVLWAVVPIVIAWLVFDRRVDL